MSYLRCAINFIILLAISNCRYSVALDSPLIDQRQTGEYNFHLNIKDVTIITIDGPPGGGILNGVEHENDDAVYEDYDYNLDELTINPLFGIFGKPSTKPPTTESSTISTSKPTVNNIQEIIALQNTSKPEVELTTESVNKITPPSTMVPDLVVIQESTAAPIVLVKQNNTQKQNDTVPPTTKPAVTVIPLQSNYNNQHHHIPVQVVMEPIVIPKRKNNNNQANLKRFPKRPAVEVVSTDSVKENQPVNIVECRNGKYRDENGRCRRVRKSNGMSQLIRLLLNKQKE